MTFIKDIEEYYNKQHTKMAHIIDSDNKSIKYRFYSNDDTQLVEIIKNNNTILKAKYSIAGVYNFQTNIWTWAYAVAFTNRIASEKSNIIKTIPGMVMKNYNDFNKEDAEELHFYCDNNSFFVTSDVIPKLVKIALFVMKGKWLVSIRHNNNGSNYIEYIIIDEILSK
jgi:hypothetical protein